MTDRAIARLTGSALVAAVVALSPVRAVAQVAATAPKPATPGATAALPSAEEVLKRYRTAIGGESAIKRHTSRTIAGTFEIMGQNMKGDLEITETAPDHLHLVIVLPGLGNLERGYDGHIGWSIDPSVGPRLLEGCELDELKHSAEFYDDMHDMSTYSSIKVVSQGPFEGEDSYEVRLVKKTGFEYTEFFSVKTSLLAGIKMVACSQMGSIPVTTVIGEYKGFGGVLTPTVTRQRMMGLESTMTITSITFDPVDPKSFDLPGPIAVLVKQQPK